MSDIRDDALSIIDESIKAVLPNEAVDKALRNRKFQGEVIVISIGKAAWNMAEAAKQRLGDQIKAGVVVTKYGHSQGLIEGFDIIEAGHPVPDANSVKGAEAVLRLVSNLTKDDQVILLLSGGGSALFEKPMEGVALEDIMNVTDQLLASGADIVEINTIRKRLSRVKGGRFAKMCGDAQIYSIVLSDVLGDRLDAIASGPAYPDMTNSSQALDIIEKYQLHINDNIKKILAVETPKEIKNCDTIIAGNVNTLCDAAANKAQELGYSPVILTTTLNCQAREAGSVFAAIAQKIKQNDENNYSIKPPCAVIAGGETVVRVSGSGKGGRNQEIALSASKGIEGMEDIVIFSVGSDGTDGPTDAAGGIVDGKSVERMKSAGVDPESYLNNNDSFNALAASNDLVITGPTGSNVNDVSIILCR
ncbi:MAG: glycerate kinase [Tindallia sp. MSAO_Bac2]|nr:MAG: glycerate kinase [Tindallia sp. MSAO_Bac2]